MKMTSQKALDKFDKVYNENYKDISRYVLLKRTIFLELLKNLFG